MQVAQSVEPVGAIPALCMILGSIIGLIPILVI